jgi:hypothetical protein
LGEPSITGIVEDLYKRNNKSGISFLNTDPRIFDQYTYINLDGEDSVDYLKGKYIVKGKAEVYTSSALNYTVFTNEITIMIENAPDEDGS